MASERPPALLVERLCVRYGDSSALESVTLAVRQDEIVGLMGRSGAGKSTLLKAVLMLVAPHAGAIRVFGAPHGSVESRSRIGWLPQRFQPPGGLSGHEFVRLSLALHGRPASRARTALMAEQLEIDPAALDRPFRSYAKGTAQKLGLLALLLADPPLLVLDEPLSGLDPAARRLLKGQLAAYRARGRAVLLSAQIPSDHDELCDRVAVLDRGRLRYIGSPADLQARHDAPTLASAFRAEIEGVEAAGRGAAAPA